MTQQGAKDLYLYLMAAWPGTFKPNASDEFKVAKMQELCKTYRDYTDVEVMNAYQKWAEENEKYPSIKNILTEIKFARALKGGKRVDPEKRYMMERIYKDGTEYAVMHDNKIMFTWEEFLNLPCNPEHLDPEEWERRFQERRTQIYAKLMEGKNGVAM